MTGLDTNILFRFFTQDDPQQSPIADRILDSFTIKNPGWISLATLVELVWAVNSKIRPGRSAIAKMLDQLLMRETIVIEKAEVVARALQVYRKGRADFGDCLIAASARAAGCRRTVTFDRIAARDAGMELLE